MKLTINKILFGILLAGVTINIFNIFDIQYLYLRAILSFIFLTFVPGLLIMLCSRIKKLVFWEYFVYTLGLSIAFLIFGGLATNWILPLLNITDSPLTVQSLLFSIDIILITMGVIAYKRNKNLSFELKLPKLDLLNKFLFILPVTFPILSILGAITLNNGGQNHLTMIMLGGLGIYTIIVSLIHKRINTNLYPFVIYCISLSLLLMYSLRSALLIGYDINTEYRIAQYTQSLGYWSPQNIINAYNATISISLLPVIYSTILDISNLIIFKLIYPILFSFAPVVLFVFLRNYVPSTLAFLGSVFFVSQFQFMQQMPALARQEIAFLFFILLLLTLFTYKLDSKNKIFLVLIFSLSLVVSHYSTAYVAIFLLSAAYLICKLYNLIKNKFYPNSFLIKQNISLKLIIIMLTFTYVWYGIYNNSLNHLHTTAAQTFSAFLDQNVSDKSASVDALLKDGHDTYTLQEVRNLQIDLRHQYQSSLDWIKNYYPINVVNQYPISIMNTNEKTSILDKFFSYVLMFNKYFIYIFMVIGMIYFASIYLVKKKFRYDIDRELIMLIFVSSVFMAAIISIPYLSIAYNLERAYQQILFIFVLAFIIGGGLLFSRLNTRFIYFPLSLVTISYLLFNSGFVDQAIGKNATLNLTNKGEDYNRFYSHASEKHSATWLDNNIKENSVIYTDEYGQLRLQAFTFIDKGIIKDISPYVLDKYAYVYADYANIVNNSVTSYYSNNSVSYEFPSEFLKENKNLIYSNNESKIYK